MTIQEYFEALLPEVMEGEARGDFEGAPDTEERYKYEHLQAVFLNRDKMENGDELYKKMYQTAMETCDRHLKEKFARQEVINVAFMSYSAAQWPAEMLYRDMENDPRFNPYIIVSPLMNRDEESRISGYNQTLLWYYNNGYKVYGGVGDTYLSWEDLGGIPDLVVHLSSWYECIPDPQQYLTLPWKCANIYIPYGIEVGDNQDRTYAVKNVFNKDIMNMLWRLYTDSKMTLQSYQKYGLIQGVNVRYSGYLKMDELVKPRTFTKQEITGLWKCPGDISKFRKIIIAPHYTVGNEGEFISSTFRQNVWFWLYLAEKYRDSVSFLFKPHPNLRGSAVQQGLFSSYEEYDRYFAAWNELPNARAIDESRYIDYFLTSDAMILDSSSFIGEYLYVQKPVLYLTRPEQGFTDLGEAVVNTYYRAPGWDLMEIERFITDVVLEGKDPLKNEREKVFEEYLDYYRLNGKLSHEIIFDDIVSSMET
ncbi:MAG: CDP-glycerol glycerophosphotransferase family protein [[Clostridium] aminophilum]|uniref:CDP-glycerol glycerophosphotransferase family protein n=1 Tax=[Clostridium] aminophilum TaxID=1526 RepID=UPI0026F1889D|nr:CDP-glycerol glycerophosphotransferase family protein [[Clostridium] aminophilum]MDD6196958.1 CDP-glycerol glycerophosphotransferase family protein [[Clostridium] aminophilum]